MKLRFAVCAAMLRAVPLNAGWLSLTLAFSSPIHAQGMTTTLKPSDAPTSARLAQGTLFTPGSNF
jgi:hypothetical protein